MKTIPITDVIDFYKRNQPDGHWFDKEPMRFFKSKLPSYAYETSAGVLFVTSEVSPSGEKKYSIRRQKPDGKIDTVGDFHSYATATDARREIKRLHEETAK